MTGPISGSRETESNSSNTDPLTDHKDVAPDEESNTSNIDSQLELKDVAPNEQCSPLEIENGVINTDSRDTIKSESKRESSQESQSESTSESDSSQGNKLEMVEYSSTDKHASENGHDSDNCLETKSTKALTPNETDVVMTEIVASPEPSKVNDTVSITSETSSDENEDDSSQDGNTLNSSNEIIVLENENKPGGQNGICRKSSSPDNIQEIISESDNDDCVVTSEDIVKPIKPVKPEPQALRRSSRKRKTFEVDPDDSDESDIEEVQIENPRSRKSKAIVINDAKSLVDIAEKKMKVNQNSQKKEPTIVIIDTNSVKAPTSQAKNTTTTTSGTTAQSLYQSIVARGTTVTPLSSKPVAATLTSQNSQPIILPSLTDDMFVVEAPSFVVPYVYEKPSVKPFREYVDKLGKELEVQKAKEEKLRIEKETENEERKKLKKQRKECGEEVSESDDEIKKNTLMEEEKKKKKLQKKEKRRRRNDDDDASWDGESSSDSEDEIVSDDDTVVIKEREDSIENIKDVTQLTAEKVCNGKSDNYFDCSLGKFFVNIGLSLVQEYVQSDLLKQQNRKLTREKKSGNNTRETQCAIASLMKNIEFSKENNAPYSFPQTKCKFCSFKAESKLVLDHHLETPHMKNNMYKCNFCEFEVKSPHDILLHMDTVHGVKGRLERAPGCHQCCNCTFEDNGKGKMARHQVTCAKKFKPELNLAPPIEWEPPAKIPKIARARNNVMGSFQNAFNRQVNNNMMRGPLNMGGAMGLGGAAYRARGRSPLPGVPIARPANLPRHSSPTPVTSNYVPNNGKPKSNNQLSISITPLPRQQPATQQQPSHSKFVICEICDGYIKDLEQLRNHMQWIHKVRIHPKMIYNRPPLNCQKCQFRFFTDQGLERHLLGCHGLVTSSMQEAANKGKDAGRCPVCGRVYQWKLLNHVTKDHNLTLKPAHLSYKCTVCTATFSMYKQFENHVYSAHSVVAKRVMDKTKSATTTAKSTNDSLHKPLKINDEITIIPQPAKPATSTKTK